MSIANSVTQIERDVLAQISFASGLPASPEQTLEGDHGLSKLNRKALAAPFQAIARIFNPDARVTRNECAALETVQDCIDLVSAKAGLP